MIASFRLFFYIFPAYLRALCAADRRTIHHLRTHTLACKNFSIIIIFLSLLHPSSLFSQERDTTDISPIDTSTQEYKVITKPITPISIIGTIDRTLPPTKIVSDSIAYLNEYASINDIVVAHNGSYVRDLGSVGHYSELILGGLGGRHIAYLHDGILLNEPLTGTYNAYWFQTEQSERVEVETGTRAFLYGVNSTGGVINSMSRDFQAIRPRTSIRYSESRYEQTFFDGMFSQNLTRNFNLTGGVQRYVTDGKYRNTDYDMWGARLRARFNASDRWNFFFSENYTQTQLGLFGGIDYLNTNPSFLFEPLQTTIINGDTYEKITRHDLRLGMAAKLFDDSSDITTLTAFYSTHFREFRNEENRPNPDSLFIQDDHHLHWQGVKFTQHFAKDLYSVDLGAEVQSRQVVESPATGYRSQVATNAYGKVDLEPTKTINVSGYARIDNSLNRTTLSHGADGILRLVDWFEIHAGYSRSFRFPTFQELYWRRRNISGPSGNFDPERHQLMEAGLKLFIGDWFQVNTRFFNRIVNDYIGMFSVAPAEPYPGVQFVKQEKVTFTGIDISAELRIWRFLAEGSGHYLKRKEFGVSQSIAGVGISRTNLQPEWWASGGVYFRDRLVENNLDLKVGFRAHVWGEQQGMEFNPEAMMFVPSSLPSLGIATVVDGLLVARIGGAYVHFIWQNLFNNNYVVSPFYPMTDRTVRFGITWELLD